MSCEWCHSTGLTADEYCPECLGNDRCPECGGLVYWDWGGGYYVCLQSCGWEDPYTEPRLQPEAEDDGIPF